MFRFAKGTINSQKRGDKELLRSVVDHPIRDLIKMASKDDVTKFRLIAKEGDNYGSVTGDYSITETTANGKIVHPSGFSFPDGAVKELAHGEGVTVRPFGGEGEDAEKRNQ